MGLIFRDDEAPFFPVRASKGPRFDVGHIVHHKVFGYRGVVIGVDERFKGATVHYTRMVCAEPDVEQPWYHVLVDGAVHPTYVPQHNLQFDESGEAVPHPLVPVYFDAMCEGRYVMTRLLN